ncbi:hypothetical protein [Methylobacterium sp. sgz302541]|uniref:hypothetical protein n=1 Tax=unclassified Methylobacterium TaxID=2615210 RepID=UPI003D327094
MTMPPEASRPPVCGQDVEIEAPWEAPPSPPSVAGLGIEPAHFFDTTLLTGDLTLRIPLFIGAGRE